jgi:nucleoside-diphosphate-sugar epimerase
MKLEHMYGLKDGQSKFIPWLLSQFKKDVSCIKLTSGEQKRDFIHVKDVVSAYLTVLNHTSKLSGFNEFDVGTGRLTTIKNLVEKIKDICEAKKTKLAFGALDYREGEMMTVKVNNKPLLDLGWKPEINLSDGLKELAKKEMTK